MDIVSHNHKHLDLEAVSRKATREGFRIWNGMAAIFQVIDPKAISHTYLRDIAIAVKLKFMRCQERKPEENSNTTFCSIKNKPIVTGENMASSYSEP